MLKTRMLTALAALSMLLAACEDQGNPGNDNLLSGASLIVVLVIVAIVVAIVLSRRRRI
jgi:hypothetical protein